MGGFRGTVTPRNRLNDDVTVGSLNAFVPVFTRQLQTVAGSQWLGPCRCGTAGLNDSVWDLPTEERHVASVSCSEVHACSLLTCGSPQLSTMSWFDIDPFSLFKDASTGVAHHVSGAGCVQGLVQAH